MFYNLIRFVFLLLFSVSVNAQNFLNVNIPGFFKDETVKLEYYEYIPKEWNGQVIIMSHGSTGGKQASIKTSFKFAGISKIANQHGFIFFVYNRKGRGLSEGNFTEETGKCDFGSLSRENQEAVLQLQQVIRHVREKHKVEKVVLMGHSRGGFLSSYYAGKFPTEVSTVVNLAGGWSTACEQHNGGFGKHHLEASAKTFKDQFWVYFDNDTYFSNAKFGDPNYSWFRKTAQQNGLEFYQFSDGSRPDGHQAPTHVPKEWGNEIFPRLVKKLNRF
jgi:pimeloyl-ACP methyl ester carboxylesterase